MTLDESLLSQYNLGFRIEPINPPPVYLTGGKAKFNLVIRNELDESREGKIAYALAFGEESTPYYRQIVPFKLDPHGITKILLHVDLSLSGKIQFGVATPGRPDDFAKLSVEKMNDLLRERRARVLTIYSIQVLDRMTYEDQKRRDELILQKLDKMPEAILAEVDRRISQATQDPKFITEVAKAQVEYLRQEQERKAEEQKKAEKPKLPPEGTYT